jgi:hypothetical protein
MNMETAFLLTLEAIEFGGLHQLEAKIELGRPTQAPLLLLCL